MSQRRDLFQDAFLACPYPMSKWVYNLGRRFLRQNARKDLFEQVFREAAERRTIGDYLEFGVFRGSSFICAYNEAQRNRLKKMRFFAFDCFEGLPEGEGGVFEAGEFAFPRHMFEKVISKAGVDLDRTVVVPGLFENSLTEDVKTRHNLRKAAIVHVDCDIYSSTKDVLRFVEDLVDVGTILMFDDWYHFGPNPDEYGEAKAFAEWRLKDCFEDLYDRCGAKVKEKGFVMTRRPEVLAAV